MSDPMTILTADHRQVKKLLKHVAASEPGSERRATVKELDASLRTHMQIEESLVYTFVSDRGDEAATEATVEHDLVRETLAKLVSMTDQPGFGAVVEMLRGGIEHHVAEEENEMLPNLKSEMSKTEWAELGESIARAKAKAGQPVTPDAGSSSRRARAR